jgi:hypothetical protein
MKMGVALMEQELVTADVIMSEKSRKEAEEIARIKEIVKREHEQEDLSYIKTGLEANINVNGYSCLERIVFAEEYIKILRVSNYRKDTSLSDIDIMHMEKFLEECEDELEFMKKLYKEENPFYEHQ